MTETTGTYKTLGELVVANRVALERIDADWLAENRAALTTVVVGFRTLLETQYPTVWPLIRDTAVVQITPDVEETHHRGVLMAERAVWFPFEDAQWAIRVTAYEQTIIEGPWGTDLLLGSDDPQAKLLELLGDWREARQRGRLVPDPLLDFIGLLQEALAMLRYLGNEVQGARAGQMRLNDDEVEQLLRESEALISRAGVMLFEVDALD